MIIVTRRGVTDEQIDHIRECVEGHGLRTHLSRGDTRTIIGCIGDEEALEGVPLLALACVEAVHPVMKPYKLASRAFNVETTTRVPLGSSQIGANEVIVIAGPCSVEGEGMLLQTAEHVSELGCQALRGGAFKPRSSPYTSDGLGEEGLRMLAAVRQRTGLPIVTEVMDTRKVELVAEYADVLQVGARNMQNFALLTEVGQLDRPVLLKRGMSATVKDLLLAAEYIMKQGNMNVVLCERGIRTFETATRNTFDLAAIPVLKRETHLPVIADPSHAGGLRHLVAPLSYAAIAAGADGLIIEVHPTPEEAVSDGDQSLDFTEFDSLMEGLRPFVDAAQRTMGRVPALR
jgi:3-deoxy-7-phosphoheptulonate synthase